MLGPAPQRLGRLTFLNGSPSSGKTTTAQMVREMSDEPLYHRSLDDFRLGYLPRYWRRDIGGVLFRRVLDAYLLSLRDLMMLGHDVVSEAVILPETLAHHLELFAEFQVLFVGIRCPLDEVRRREEHRRDRLTTAAILSDTMHVHGHYDLEIDTSVTVPEEAAKQVLALMADPPAITAFEILRQGTA